MPEETSYTEKTLLDRVSNGDEQAFRDLVTIYSGLLFTFVNNHLNNREATEDIVQDIFLKIWQIRETLSGIRSFKAFLLTMAKNHAFNAIKKMVRQRNKEWNWQHDTINTEYHVEMEPLYGLIDQAVNALPPQQQRAWLLCRRQGLKYHQAALQMDVSKDAIKKYLQLAGKSIKDYITRRVELPLVLLLVVFFLKKN